MSVRHFPGNFLHGPHLRPRGREWEQLQEPWKHALRAEHRPGPGKPLPPQHGKHQRKKQHVLKGKPVPRRLKRGDILWRMQRPERFCKRQKAILHAKCSGQRFFNPPFRRGKRSGNRIPHDLLRKPLHKRVYGHDSRKLRMQGRVHKLRAPAAIHPAGGIPFLPGRKAARTVRLVVPHKADLRRFIRRISAKGQRAHGSKFHPAPDMHMLRLGNKRNMQRCKRAVGRRANGRFRRKIPILPRGKIQQIAQRKQAQLAERFRPARAYSLYACDRFPELHFILQRNNSSITAGRRAAPCTPHRDISRLRLP